MAQLEQPVVFLTSNEGWDELWLSKHHWANTLRRWARVYFINPAPRWRPATLLSTPKLQVRQVEDNLYVVDLPRRWPMRGLGERARHWNDRQNVRALHSLLRPEDRTLIWWQFDLFRFIQLPPAPGGRRQLRLYHVVDPYDHFPTDPPMARQADLVLVVNPSFQDRYLLFNDRVKHLPHGLPQEAYQPNAERVAALRRRYGRYALLAGSLNGRLQYALLLKAAQQSPQLNWLVLGPERFPTPQDEALYRQFAALPNVHYGGVVPAQELVDYVAASEAGVVAYHFEREKQHRVAMILKILHYLAPHRPVISTVNSQLPSLEGNSVHMAKKEAAFLEKIAQLEAGPLPCSPQAIDEALLPLQYPQLRAQVLQWLAEL